MKTIFAFSILTSLTTACVAPTVDDQLDQGKSDSDERPAWADSNEPLPSIFCEGDDTALRQATAYFDAVMNVDLQFTGSGLQKRSSLEPGRVVRIDLNSDGFDEIVVVTHDDYFDPETGVTEKGILAFSDSACRGQPIGVWTGLDLLMAEDEDDVGIENFRNVGISRAEACQLDLYRMGTEFYTFSGSVDECES